MTPSPSIAISTQENALQLFQFENVATGDRFALSAQERDGQVWFVAADVCKALGLRNSRQSLATLDDDDKGVCTTDTPGGAQQVATINESGLYSLIFRSRKEGAKRFKKWAKAGARHAVSQYSMPSSGSALMSWQPCIKLNGYGCEVIPGMRAMREQTS